MACARPKLARKRPSWRNVGQCCRSFRRLDPKKRPSSTRHGPGSAKLGLESTIIDPNDTEPRGRDDGAVQHRMQPKLVQARYRVTSLEKVDLWNNHGAHIQRSSLKTRAGVAQRAKALRSFRGRRRCVESPRSSLSRTVDYTHTHSEVGLLTKHSHASGGESSNSVLRRCTLSSNPGQDRGPRGCLAANKPRGPSFAKRPPRGNPRLTERRSCIRHPEVVWHFAGVTIHC